MTDDLSERIAKLSSEKRELFDRLLAGRGIPREGGAPVGLELPSGKIETTLASIWSQALRVPEIGRHDDYFALGGDSIVSIQIIAKSRAAGLHFTSRELFDHPSIAALADLLDRPERRAASDTTAAAEARERVNSHPFPDARLSAEELRSLLGEGG